MKLGIIYFLLLIAAMPSYANVYTVAPSTPPLKMTTIPVADIPIRKLKARKSHDDECLSEGYHCDINNDQCCEGLECTNVSEDTICFEASQRR
jgi:hypothetical protein